MVVEIIQRLLQAEEVVIRVAEAVILQEVEVTRVEVIQCLQQAAKEVIRRVAVKERVGGIRAKGVIRLAVREVFRVGMELGVEGVSLFRRVEGLWDARVLKSVLLTAVQTRALAGAGL